jgi:hypothetical protein
MIELRRALHSYLRSIHPRVYFQRAPDTAQFPYITYSFEMIPDGEGFELVVLDIDGWDMPDDGDTTGLEGLMSDVKRSMDKKTLTTDDLVVSFYLDRKLALEDDNPKIIRRKYVYQGRIFERGDN